MLKIHSRADHEIGEVTLKMKKNEVPIPQSSPLQEFRPE